ncbi:MAG: hypothetical protein ACUVSS_05165, partial [Anaerolineae bacterium]
MSQIMLHRIINFLLRFMLFLVPITALAVAGFVGVSLVSAQLRDVPAASRVALLRPAAEELPALQPESLERGALGLYLR